MEIDREIIQSFLDATSLDKLLSILLARSAGTGIIRIRYYHYSLHYGTLISSESIGHSHTVATRFREGFIAKRLNEHPLDTSDSFWCFFLLKPVVITRHAHPVANGPICESDGPLPALTVNDGCPELTLDEKSPVWVDFPLVVGGFCIGKLSCDLDRYTASKGEVDRLHSFWTIASIAASFLKAISSRRLAIIPMAWDPSGCSSSFPRAVPPKENVSVDHHLDAIKALADSQRKEFLSYCVETLPCDSFKARHASLFLLHRDTFGSSKLVLVRSSHPDARPLEDQAYYDLDEAGLTPWVARTKSPLRQPEMPPEKQPTCNNHPGPQWANKIKDCDTLRTWLAVPLLDESRSVIGVLRLTEKIDPSESFTVFDERNLEYISSRALGPKLEKILHAEFSNGLLPRLQNLMMLVLRDSMARIDIPHALEKILAAGFPESASAARSFLLVMQSPDGILRNVLLGGSLDLASCSNIDALAHELFSIVLGSKREDFIIIHHFANAGINSIDSSKPGAPRSLLIAKVAYETSLYGFVCVFSNRLDILSRALGSYLSLVGLQAGALYAVRQLAPYSLAQRGLKHDYLALHCGLDRVLRRSDDPMMQLDDARKVSSFCATLINTYCQTFPILPEDLARRTSPSDINVMLNETFAAARASLQTSAPITINVKPKSLIADIYEPFVATIIFNLLRNAQSAADINNPLVAITAWIESSEWLNILVENNGKGMSSEQVSQFFEIDPIKWLRQKEEDNRALQQSGLFLSNQLVKSYRLPDGRQGKLHPPKEGVAAGCSILLEIPIQVSPIHKTHETSNHRQ
jgi:hypothetical protein